MLIAAVLCLCAAVATAGFGLWLLTRPRAADPVRQVSARRGTDPARRRSHAHRRRSGGAVGAPADGPARRGGVCRRGRGHGRGRVLAERQGSRAPRGARLAPQLRGGLRRRVRDVHVVLQLSPHAPAAERCPRRHFPAGAAGGRHTRGAVPGHRHLRRRARRGDQGRHRTAVLALRRAAVTDRGLARAAALAAPSAGAGRDIRRLPHPRIGRARSGAVRY